MIVILLFIVVILALISFQLKMAKTLEGTVIKISETHFKILTDKDTEFVIPLLLLENNDKIVQGDLVIIYYEGDILETVPSRIKGIKKIKIK